MAITQEMMDVLSSRWREHPNTRELLKKISEKEIALIAQCVATCDGEIPDTTLRLWLSQVKALRAVQSIIENVDKQPNQKL